MAKAKFYRLDEAAAKLGVSEEQVKQMASRGQLRQFRDRDQLMFRADEVDALAAVSESAAGLSMGDSGDTGISLADSGDTGAITLGDTGGDTGSIPLADTGMQDTGEVKLSLDDSSDSLDLSDKIDLEGTGTLSGTDVGSSKAGSTGLDQTDLPLSEDAGGSSDGIALADTGGDSGMALSGTGLGTDIGTGISNAHLDEDEKDGSSGLGLALDDLGGSSGVASSLGDSTDTDGLTLGEESDVKLTHVEDARQATGISVFDADEVDEADPMAQTLVTRATPADEELALESVGSGSGLLDLTRESDDTSLGAELLDEIYPGGEQTGETKMDTAAGSSGVFDGAVTLEAAPDGADAAATEAPAAPAASKRGKRAAAAPAAAAPSAPEAPAPSAAAPAQIMTVEAAEPADPVGSGFSAGLLLGAAASLVLAFFISLSALFDVSNAVTTALSESTTSLGMYSGILLGGSIIFGVIGLFIGKMMR